MRKLFLILLSAALMAGPVSSTAKELKAGYGITDASPNITMEVPATEYMIQVTPEIFYQDEKFASVIPKTNYTFAVWKIGEVQNRSMLRMKFNRLKNSK